MKIEQERWALEIGNRLRTARTRIGLSQAELSDRVGVDRKTCYNIEKDKVDGQVGLHTLERLARALGVSPSWLTFGIEDPKIRAQDLLLQAAAEKRMRLDAVRDLAEQGLFGVEEDEDNWGEELGHVTKARKKKEEEEERRARASFPVWPHGYRPLSIRYPELPPLDREPLALPPSLPRRPSLLAAGTPLPAPGNLIPDTTG